jgi:hypothetical protein
MVLGRVLKWIAGNREPAFSGPDYPVTLFSNGAEIAQFASHSYDTPRFCGKLVGLNDDNERWLNSVTKYWKYLYEIEDEDDEIVDSKLAEFRQKFDVSDNDFELFNALVVGMASGERIHADQPFFDDGYLDFRPGDVI